MVSDAYSLYKITLRAKTKIGFGTDFSETNGTTDEDGKSIQIYIYCYFFVVVFLFLFYSSAAISVVEIAIEYWEFEIVYC